MRLEFLPASVLPVFVGAALAFYRMGVWNWPLFVGCVFGVGAIHVGANVLNDYFDHCSGGDAANREFVRPFTGGTRLIQQGVLAPRTVLRMGLACLAAGVLVGIYLVFRVGPGVLWFMAPAAAAALAYSVPRVGLASLGLGEPAVAIVFGVLTVMGSYFVQTGVVSAESFWVSLPIAVLIVAVLFINQFQDFRADREVGKRNWVVRLGRRRSAYVYAFLMALSIALLLGGAAAGLFPGFLAWAALAGVLAVPAVRRTLKEFEHPAALAPANAATIAMHTVVSFAIGALLVVFRWLGR